MAGDPRPEDDREPDHSEDPRTTRRGAGGYPEDSPAAEHGESDPRTERSDRRDRERDADPGQATGNPGAAGADPGRRD